MSVSARALVEHGMHTAHLRSALLRRRPPRPRQSRRPPIRRLLECSRRPRCSCVRCIISRRAVLQRRTVIIRPLCRRQVVHHEEACHDVHISIAVRPGADWHNAPPAHSVRRDYASVRLVQTPPGQRACDAVRAPLENRHRTGNVLDDLKRETIEAVLVVAQLGSRGPLNQHGVHVACSFSASREALRSREAEGMSTLTLRVVRAQW